MTDKKTPLTTEQKKETSSKAPTTKAAARAKKVSTKEITDSNQNKVSKLAIIAIFIALGSTATHYVWQQQQSQLLILDLSQQIDQKSTATFNQYQAETKQALTQLTTQVNNNNQVEKVAELNALLSQLERKVKQRQPSDWILHEAEYLIRIAARTLWLESDTTAAINLLKNADARLAALNDPTFLPVRELVHQDIKSLELMPTLQTDEVVLTLMALNRQISILPLAMVDIGIETNKDSNELSNDINDWKANLTKTWEKFLNDFIRVRQRTGMIEPLVSPEQQQHLKQNLNLKIQLALWAASERKSDIYQKALADMQRWFTEFFDLKESSNQHFLQALTDLQTKRISYDYPSELTSLSAVRIAIRNQTATLVPLPTKSETSPTKTADNATEALTEKVKQPEVVKTEPVALPKQTQITPTKTTYDSTEVLTEKVKPFEAAKVEPEKSPSSPNHQDVQPKVEGIK